MDIFAELESNVRSYCRRWPAVFSKAKGSVLTDEAGNRYIDFFAGASSLNYGHNDDAIKVRLLEYLASDSITHGLDCHTVAKREFLTKFHKVILQPRGLSYKCQFCGPTGTNAVEAALKIARKATGRLGVFAFMGGFHGMSLGSLAATGNKMNRAGAAVPLTNVTFMPFPHGFMQAFDTIEYIETVLSDENSGIELPAAIIVETVQAEGGVVIAPVPWLQRLRDLCDRHRILLICDEIQVGCGRTGPFFSFERAGIAPDVVTLAKSLSGYGLPLALVLIKPSLDVWQPGEHTGTFRGNQLAFISATAALEYWTDSNFQAGIRKREDFLGVFLTGEIQPLDTRIGVRGVGCIWGIDLQALGQPDLAARVARRCFELGLVIECAGRGDSVIKLMPPLNIEMSLLDEGCRIIRQAVIDSLLRPPSI
ncbi:MAG: diaminobutyrate--2-oxoglutarate transaminase [Planctomycetota bacterium]|nr:diaminobutyrate--2-oxoglutarate transaminase [Planctomycetota bacterium]